MSSRSEALEKMLEDEVMFNKVLHSAFKKVDTDKSGQLDKNEMHNVITTFYQDVGLEPPGPEESEEYIDMLDTGDKDGLIDEKEFRPMLRGMLSTLLSVLQAQE